MKRSAGILLPVFSLPSPYGIGSLGAEARAFVDFLHAAGQSWWQVLPVGPAGDGNSPYTSESTFAGNPYFIDLDLLAEEGLLTKSELENAKVPPADKIDYSAVKKPLPSVILGWTTIPYTAPPRSILQTPSGPNGRTTASGFTKKPLWNPGGPRLPKKSPTIAACSIGSSASGPR